MRDRDRVVDRRSVPAVRLAVVHGEEVHQLRDEDADRTRHSRRRLCTSGPVTALCVTSRPIIVTSKLGVPKTICAASGSAQMLNSARRRHVPLGNRSAHEDDPVDAGRRRAAFR